MTDSVAAYPDFLPGGASFSCNPPWMNAAGTLGFLPPARGSWESAVLGKHCAFVTNPISWLPRMPAAERGVLSFEGGVVLHSGLPNPGLRTVLRRYARAWQGAEIPIWVHLIADHPQEVQNMVRRLEGIEGVAAVELSFAPGMSGGLILEIIRAAAGELPVVAQIACLDSHADWLQDLQKAGAAAICLGAPRGELRRVDGGWMAGRVYGPALLPLTIAAVRSLKRWGLPVIASGGIYRREDGETLLAAGAAAVQLDTVLWRGWAD